MSELKDQKLFFAIYFLPFVFPIYRVDSARGESLEPGADAGAANRERAWFRAPLDRAAGCAARDFGSRKIAAVFSVNF